MEEEIMDNLLVQGDSLKQVTDSLLLEEDTLQHVVAKLTNDTTFQAMKDLMETTADNTTFGWLPDGWALIIALVSLIASIVIGYTQWQTERNTSRLSLKEQKLLMTDMIRHFYRNFVVSHAIRAKLLACQFSAYPSEEHLKKLMVNLEDIHLNLFYKKDSHHKMMNELYVKLRNYNLEIDVICDHLKDPAIDHDTKKRDLDTLTFKCYYLTQELTRVIGTIWHKDREAYEADAQQVIEAVQTKNRADNADEKKHYSGALDVSVPEQSYYLKALFRDHPETFLQALEQDVRIEAGRNASDAEKIHLIKFNHND